MTKIILKSEAAPVFNIFKTPLSILLHPAIVAYHESRGVIYVTDPYAETAISHLTEAGVALEVTKF